MAQHLYSAGSFTNGSAVVTDATATFITDGLAAGDGVSVTQSGVSYEIGSVDLETQITLTAPYAGTTDTGVEFVVWTDFTSPDSIPELNRGDVETATIFTRAMRKIQDLITTAGNALTAHLADTVDAHDASAISNVPAGNVTSTTVQAAIDELQTDIDTRALDSALTTHVSDTTTHGTTGDIVGTSDTQTLTNKTLTSPDINGGTSDDLSSLSVVADSDGNVSRYVMTTAAGASGDSGYWAKIATFVPTASSGTNSRFSGSYKLVSSYYDIGQMGEASINVSFVSTATGLNSSATAIQVLASSGPAVSGDSFKLVQATASRTSPIELWVRKDTLYQKFSLIEIGAQQHEDVITVTYNDGAAWQSATPTGAVVITSAWAGGGTYTPIVKGATTAGVGTYTVQSGAYVITGGVCIGRADLAWTAHTGTGVMQVTLPVAPKAGVRTSVVVGRALGVTVPAVGALMAFAEGGSADVSFRVTTDTAGNQTAVDIDSSVSSLVYSFAYPV